MNYRKIIFLFVIMLFSVTAYAEKVVVIVNASNPQALTSNDIKGIYSDNVIQWENGDAIKVYDLPVKMKARETFSQSILGSSARSVAKDWANRKITNTAKNPPKTKKERLVVASVKKKANAIGYVSESAIVGKTGVKVIMTLK